MKNRFPREFYIPKSAVKVSDKASSAVAYVYEAAGAVYAVAFHGKAEKPDWHFRFKSPEARAKRIVDHFVGVQARDKMMADRSTARKSEGHGLAVGDILRSSWGYDQTNVDFYEVTAIVGKRMVEIRPIAQETVESTVHLTGKCVPVPGQYTGKVMRKAARNGGVRITSYAWASKIEPKTVSGVKVYDASHFSSYA